jgi:HTH-type transcriptional regulator, sugar sensing transcriptional regulator
MIWVLFRRKSSTVEAAPVNLEEALARIGIADKRARFYLAALELGEAPVQKIAERAGISRTTAYDVLPRLTHDGLVSRIDKGGRLHVAAEDPARLLAVLEDRRRTVEEVLPELRSRYSRSAARPRIRFYEGRDAIDTVLYDTLECRSKRLKGILSMTSDLFKSPGRLAMERYVARRIAAGVHLQVVRSREQEAGQDRWLSRAEDLRELRWAPAGALFTMTTWTYDDKVSLISSRRENFGIIVQSEEFSDLMNTLFAVLWQASTPAGATRPGA